MKKKIIYTLKNTIFVGNDTHLLKSRQALVFTGILGVAGLFYLIK